MQGAGRNPSCGARAGQAPHLSPVAAGVQLETRQLLPGSRSSSHITAATPPSCLAWWHGVFRLPSGEPPGSSVHLSLKVPPRWGCLLTSFLGFHGDREASTPPPWELTQNPGGRSPWITPCHSGQMAGFWAGRPHGLVPSRGFCQA